MSPTSYQTAPPRVVPNRLAPGSGADSTALLAGVAARESVQRHIFGDRRARRRRRLPRRGGGRRLGRACGAGAARGCLLELLQHALEGGDVAAVGREVAVLQVGLCL